MHELENPLCDFKLEGCLLASIMIDPEILEAVMPLVNRKAFYYPANKIIFDAIARRYQNRSAVDAVLVEADLKKFNQYEDVGGIDYLKAILISVPSSKHGIHYANEVNEKAKLRAIAEAADDAIKEIRAAGAKPDEIADRLERAAASIREMGFVDTIRTIGEIVREVMAMKRSGVVTKVSFGIPSLDHKTAGGMPIRGMTFIGARPGMGKSQLMKQILLNLAGEGKHVGLVSIEESDLKIGENLLSNVSGVSNSTIGANLMGEDPSVWSLLEDAMESLDTLPLFVDPAKMRLRDIEATIRRMVKRDGCEVVAVDHLHLIDSGQGGSENRTQEIRFISNSLKRLFKELKIAGLVALQVNRGNDDAAAVPAFKDLRDGGSLEEDGDLILQLQRADYYNCKEEPFNPDHELKVYINKNKGGPIDNLKLHFDGLHQRVRDWSEFVNEQAVAAL